LAVEVGIPSLETRVPVLLPGMVLGAGVDAVTVRHLRTMSSGLDFAWFGAQPVRCPDLAQEMLRQPTRGRAPGSSTPT
jgi:CubicO group peptidase (beta-lactamase class C family)